MIYILLCFCINHRLNVLLAQHQLMMFLTLKQKYQIIKKVLSSMERKIVKELKEQYDIEDDAIINQILAACRSRKVHELAQKNVFKKATRFQKFQKFYQKLLSCLFLRYEITNKQSIFSFKNKESVLAILIGPCGNGKTTIFNKLCGTSYSAGQSQLSLSRDIVQQQSKYQFSQDFYIIDCPGTTSLKDKYMHAAYLKQALTLAPLNTVFILVKYENRLEDIILSCQRQSLLVQGYEEKIVFLITHIDHSEDRKRFIETVNKMLDQKKIKNQVIYISTRQVEDSDLSTSMFKIASSMKKSRIRISEEKFYNNFQIKLTDQQIKILNKELAENMQKMNQITKKYIDCGKQFKQHPEKQAIIQDLSIHLKRQLEIIVDQFIQYLKNLEETNKNYEVFYSLQNHLKMKVSEFQNSHHFSKKGQLMSYQKSNDIRDLVKQCPNPECKLIWMRIQQCPNTVCGKRPSCTFDYSNAQFNYQIVRDEKMNTISVIKQKKKEKAIEKKQEKEKEIKKQKQIGCSKAMNFDSLPRLPNIEDILMSWYSVTSFEEVIARFQNDKSVELCKKNIQTKAKEASQQALKKKVNKQEIQEQLLFPNYQFGYPFF